MSMAEARWVLRAATQGWHVRVESQQVFARLVSPQVSLRDVAQALQVLYRYTNRARRSCRTCRTYSHRNSMRMRCSAFSSKCWKTWQP